MRALAFDTHSADLWFLAGQEVAGTESPPDFPFRRERAESAGEHPLNTLDLVRLLLAGWKRWIERHPHVACDGGTVVTHHHVHHGALLHIRLDVRPHVGL